MEPFVVLFKIVLDLHVKTPTVLLEGVVQYVLLQVRMLYAQCDEVHNSLLPFMVIVCSLFQQTKQMEQTHTNT